MKLHPNKKTLLNYFMYYGWAIIVFAIVSFASLTLILSAVNKIYDHQRFSIFFSAYGLKEERFKNELLDELKDDGVIEINYFDYPCNSDQIVTYYDVYGEKSDINILSETDIKDMQQYVGDYFINITGYLKTELNLSNNYTYYSYDEKPYAIKIYDKDDNSYNDKFIYQEWINFSKGELTDNFYILLRRNSINFGEYGDKNKTTNAIKGLRYLINENTK